MLPAAWRAKRVLERGAKEVSDASSGIWGEAAVRHFVEKDCHGVQARHRLPEEGQSTSASARTVSTGVLRERW